MTFSERQRIISCFIEHLVAATKQVAAGYFLVPVAGQDDAIYRERVYCYELYHQLRRRIEGDPRFAACVVSGEIDKGGHPIIRRCAPDFVLHYPGRMDENLVVIEVKPIDAAKDGMQKDLDTLKGFLSHEGRYQMGIELVYGDDEPALDRFRTVFGKAASAQLQLFWHRSPGEQAIPILR